MNLLKGLWNPFKFMKLRIYEIPNTWLLKSCVTWLRGKLNIQTMKRTWRFFRATGTQTWSRTLCPSFDFSGNVILYKPASLMVWVENMCANSSWVLSLSVLVSGSCLQKKKIGNWPAGREKLGWHSWFQLGYSAGGVQGEDSVRIW